MKYLLILALFVSQITYSQITRKALFIGNSYIYSNDMPGMVSSLANADGNTLIKDQSTPGGYTLEGHSSNASTLLKITAVDWDFVVLQEQSQLPSFPWSQVTSDVFPYAEILCDSIRSATSCAIPLFFDTWGRRDGDSQWDSINTFDKMNARLLNAYTAMSDNNSSLMAPVGAGFNHVQDDVASPITHTAMYAGDGSHPSVYGTYLAACTFYEIIFNTSPVGNTYIPGGINATEASYLQFVAHHILNDVDSLNLDFTQPIADFTFTISGTTVDFSNLSEHSFDWNWDFDNGSISTDENPSIDFGTYGSFDVMLTSNYCGNSDDTTITITLTPLSTEDNITTFEMYPNPSKNGQVKFVSSTPMQIEILEISGKLVEQVFIINQAHIHLETGVYLIKSDKTVKKLVIL